MDVNSQLGISFILWEGEEVLLCIKIRENIIYDLFCLFVGKSTHDQIIRERETNVV